MNKIKIVIYALIAMSFQVILGQLTDQGQGGIGMLTFVVLIELDPQYSFTYLLSTKPKETKENEKK
jgi:hypothetical protein